MTALRRRFRRTSRQTYRQIPRAERISRRSGIDHFLFRQLHRRDLCHGFTCNRHQARLRPALDHHFADPGSLRPGDDLINRFFAPQGVFIIQRQEGDIGAFEHLLVDLLRLFAAGPQTWTVVVIENHLTAIGTAFAQQ